jgi:hypothetical protein
MTIFHGETWLPFEKMVSSVFEEMEGNFWVKIDLIISKDDFELVSVHVLNQC